MKRLALLALAASGWITAAVLFWVLPTEEEWDARYREGRADCEDAAAQSAGA